MEWAGNRDLGPFFSSIALDNVFGQHEVIREFEQCWYVCVFEGFRLENWIMSAGVEVSFAQREISYGILEPFNLLVIPRN